MTITMATRVSGVDCDSVATTSGVSLVVNVAAESFNSLTV